MTSVGTALLDCLAAVDEHWLADHVDGRKGGCVAISGQAADALLAELERGYPVARIAGGAAANTLSALAMLGFSARLLAMVGNDETGRAYCESFAKTGGDCSCIKVHETLATGRCICLVTPDSDRTMRTYQGASAALPAESIAEPDLSGADFLLMEGYMMYDLPAVERAFGLAEKQGIPIGFDLSSFELVEKFRTEIPALLPRCKIIFANRQEAAALAEMPETVADEELLDCLHAFAPVVCLKLGARGAVIRTREETVFIPAAPVQPVDSTGAGDHWQAGFLYGYLRNLPVSLCGRFGALCAAEILKIQGARLSADAALNLKNKFNQLEKELIS